MPSLMHLKKAHALVACCGCSMSVVMLPCTHAHTHHWRDVLWSGHVYSNLTCLHSSFSRVFTFSKR